MQPNLAMRRTGHLLLLVLFGCNSSPTGPTTAPGLPMTPPDPTPKPSTLTSVANINSGNVQGEVLIAGMLVSVLDASNHRYSFSDDGGTSQISVDFSSDHVPTTATLVLIWGKVQSGLDIDVIAWAPIPTIPTNPVTPPITPPDPTTPPSLTITKIRDLRTFSEVIIAGTVTRQNGTDDDEWFVEDNTGEIVVDFRSDHVPGVGTAIFVWGTVSSSEIDEIAWCRQPDCS